MSGDGCAYLCLSDTAGQMASYPQEGTGGYPSSRSSYGTSVDSYGQQSAAYSTGE